MARWGVFTEVAAGTQFFCKRFADFFGTQTVKNDFQLSHFCQGFGLRFLVMLTVTITPNISTNVKSSLSETTGYIIRLDLVVHWQLVALFFDTRIE